MRNHWPMKLITHLSLLAALVACTKQPEPATVTFTIPSVSGKAISRSVSASSTDDATDWGLSTPSTTSSLDCFVIFVGGGAEADMNRMSCSTSESTEFRFGYFAGMVGRGQTTTVTIPSGKGRVFTLVGLDSVDGTCEQMPEISKTRYSAPLVIGRAVADISAGDNAVKIDGSISSATLESCNFQSGSGPQSGFFLGSGNDGDLTSSSPVDLTTTMNQSSTRYLSTTARVLASTSTATAGEYTLNLDGNFSGVHYDVGDEVALYIAAEGNSGACGQLFAGFRVEGRVSQAATWVPSTHSTIKVKVADSRFASVTTANLAAAGVSGTSFCRMVATRVPHFRNVTLNSGASITVPSFGALNTGPNPGGLLLMRVLGNLVAQSGTTFLDASGKGFKAFAVTSGRGESVSGASASTTIALANGGGGGDSSYGAGGGGHGGAGLPGLHISTSLPNAASAGGTVGDQYGCGYSVVDPLMRCLFGKVYFGGAGGHANSGTGIQGYGGGIVNVWANTIQVSSGATLGLKANGQSGDNVNAGGAGGTLLVRALKLNVVGTLAFSAKGGDGGDASTNKFGSGGGGRIHVDVAQDCQTTVVTKDVNGGTAGPGSGSPVAGNPGTWFKSGAGATLATCQLPAN